MAPATAARASAAARDESSDPEAAKLAVWKQALYDRVRETRRENDLFTQEDLTDLGVIPNKDKGLLLQVIQALSNDKLFVTFREASGQVCWKWRDEQEAHKLVSPPFP
jgi:DNA-directed RNA polymerase III subunit RPC6